MYRQLGILLAFFVSLHAAKERKQLASQQCVPEDVVFLVDSSTGVGNENFRRQLDFIKTTISNYHVSPQCIHVGVVTFSDGGYNQFYLNQYYTTTDLYNAIDRIQYRPGPRYTTEGLKYLMTNSFSSSHGARRNARKVGILVSNGSPANYQAFTQQANQLKSNGISLYTVGVGSGAHLQQFASVASSPANRHSLSAEDYGSLSDLSYPLAYRTLSESPAINPVQPCLQRADLVFLVDGSGSIGPTNFDKLKSFLKGVTSQLDVGKDKVHIGVEQFSNYPSIEFPLDMHTDRASVEGAIDNINYMSGGTNTGSAISYMSQQMFSQTSGARANVPRIAVVITDGKSSSSQATSAAADQARQNNIAMIAVGVGNGVDMNELHSIADDPDSANTFTVNSYDQLNSITAQIIQKACQVRTTAPSLTNNNAGVTLPPDPCQDTIPDCKRYGSNVCVDYAPWAKDNCQRYCGFCTILYTTAPPPCVDTLSNCPVYTTVVCNDPKYEGWAKDNCRKFCGFCGPSVSAVGFYGQCNYKGKSYRPGQKWTDGCDYECTCEDGATGRYKCYNKCPLYYNLPAECTLVRDPTQCCQTPVCNFNQNLQTFEQTSPARTQTGIGVCVYKGKQYYQSQSWKDGCDYQCTCTNGNSGLYKCQSLCPQYGSLPPYCHMVKQPGDCCSKPVCEFKTQQGSFTGTGSISGNGVGTQPTDPPPCVDALSNCVRYGKDVCKTYVPWAKTNCRKFCNLCNVKPTPSPSDHCMYQGIQYGQGQGWKVSCDTECVCENAIYGYYRCVNTCPTYNNLPKGCYETKKAGQCCPVVECENGVLLSSTNNLGTIGSGGQITVKNPAVPQIAPTLPSGGKPLPGTGGTGFTAPSLSGCLYKGVMYIQDQRWNDGCQFSCECRDASTGEYQCTSRCPTYLSLPSSCQMVTDDSDSCCKKPKCADPNTPIVPTFPQTSIGHGVVKPPSGTDLYQNYHPIQYTVIYNNGPTTPAPSRTPRPVGYCVRNGQRHNQNETWNEGCEYVCSCEDASTGRWRCHQRCKVYNNIPKPWCFLIQDPNDACCQIPKCNFNQVTTSFNASQTAYVTVTPRPTTTPKPTTPRPRVCNYNGKQYGQGQIWYDGCNYRCSCDNAMNGYYRCVNRCPVYKNVPDACKMVPDQRDPTCCRVPECHFTPAPGGTSGQGGGVPTLAPGSIQGQGTGVNIGYCLYKGKQYGQGEKWDDGCSYHCQCMDTNTGRYTCTDMCPRYSSLPAQCTLITDFRNTCCKVPDCGFSGVTQGISGSITLAPPIPGQPTPTPGPGIPNPNPTSAPGVPILNYCIYKGVKYYQGQSWEDGCDKKCMCDRATEGLYTCNDRCPKYSRTLPKECHMAVSANDPCCQEPKCDIPATLSNITGTISPNMIPTLAPPGVISGNANTPTPMPLAPGQTTLAPKPINYCVYKGSQHAPGTRWDDGCDYTCVCKDGMTGHYECTEKCPKYGQLPRECYLQKDPANPCCQKPECIFNPNVGEFTNAPTTKAPLPGSTNAPTPKPSNPNPFPTPGLPKDVCVYKGKSYTQGQSWYDNCDYKCNCEDAKQGIYRCSRRCVQYQQTAGCTLTQDPNDPICCKVPKCQIPPSYSNTTGFIDIPTAAPGVISGGSVTRAPTPNPTPGPGQQPTPGPGQQPTPGPGQQPTPGPGQQPTPGVTPAPTPACIYKGARYTQGQRWQDGCDYNCECTNANTGYYRCTELCPKYNGLPPQCQLVTDVYRPCCKKPYCNFQGVQIQATGTPAPFLGTTLTPRPLRPGETPAPTPPIPEVCVYNGVQFKQGATWKDGCALNCVCENGKTGFYRCDARCARYDQVPAGCTMMTDPNDNCCRIPVCQPVAQTTLSPQPGTTRKPLLPGQTYAPTPAPTANPNPNPSPTPPQIPSPTGSIIGIGVTPTPRPGMTPAPNAKPVCVYKGVQYTQNQKWDDGCQYKCECIDAKTGKYKCTKRCGDYPQLPPYCTLVSDPNDQCCRKPICQPSPVTTQAPNPLNPGNPNSPGTIQTPNVGPTISPNPLGPHNTNVPNLTVGPGPNPTRAPNPNPSGTTQAPVPRDMCVMNGRQYTQGQQWYDGCDRICVCEDGKSGFYRCRDRCRKYGSVPSSCIMVADPKDPTCCRVPSCIPGSNGFPTPTPGPNGATNAPQLITNVPVGSVTGYAKPTPTATPSPIPGQTTVTPIRTPAPKQVCVYKGVEYSQGQRWQDGCDYNCVCENGMTGKYMCLERCPSYPALPAYCSLQQDPKDYCCQVPVCNYNMPIPTPAPNITPSPSGQNPTLVPGMTQTPNPNPTVAPNPNPTVSPNPNPTVAPNPLAVCIYKGVPYKQGQAWNEGCQKKCRCDDADKNIYTCFDRCPSYAPRQGCVMKTDPQDACCQVPSCTLIPTLMPTPSPNPVGPGGKTQAPNLFSTPAPSAYPSPIPTGQTGTIVGKPAVPPLRAVCEYRGRQYTQGQTWQDGCQYNCICIDGVSGQYRCSERCPRYPSVPSYCRLVQDPKDQCCKVPECTTVAPTPAPIGTPTPGPNRTPLPGSTFGPTPQVSQPVTPGPIPTPQPTPKNVCIMNGKSYTQGQQWDDGCKQICVCDDGTTGHYTCRTRCPQYNNVAPNCLLVPDPKDPKCCKVPQCDQPNPNKPTGVTGTIIGTNPTPIPTQRPTPNPNPNVTPNPLNTPTPGSYPYPTPYPGGTYPPYMLPSTNPTRAPNPNNTPVPGQRTTVQPTLQPTPQPSVCVYKGKAYQQGMRWRDGCTYNCVCEDGKTGRYVCTEICPRYPQLPSGCVMVNDPANPCCKKPDCSNPTPAPRLTPSPRPGVSPTPAPNNTPVPAFCIYNGIPYTQGQSWEDGCDKICKCEDAVNRQINCKDRCATYPKLKAGCSLITDPNDKCCQVPNCVDPITLVPVGNTGTIDGQNVPLSPGSNQPVTGKRNVCIYNGKMYQQGQQWDDGCSYHCVCLDASTGHYQCKQRCAKVPNLPPYCTMVNDPTDQCCQKPYCQNPNPNPQPTPQPTLSPNPNGNPTPAPGGNPTPAPGQTTVAPKPKGVCVYKNQYYKENQQWYDGCNALCRCEDASTGYYRCQERCSRYPSVPSQCTLVPDPKDPSCCEVPKCPVKPTAGPVPTPGFVPTPITPKPGEFTGLAPVPTAAPTPSPIPGQTPSPTLSPPLPKKGCYYKGVVYQKGQNWSDGCQFNCACLDDMTGQYKCTEKCSKFPNLDSRCVLLQDPQNPCCQKPFCDFVNPTPFPTGVPTPQPIPTPSPKPGVLTVAPNLMSTPRPVPTKAPPPGYCVYKGVFYTQGQTWNDGCDRTCQCDDSSTGQYSCHQRCRTYPQVQQNCVLKTDPNDNCCLVPDCNQNLIPTPGPNPTPNPGVNVSPQPGGGVTGTQAPQFIYPTPILPGSFTGTGVNPATGNYNPGVVQTGLSNACIYKGVAYNQGDKWDDGCTYKCECIDSIRGQYRCTDRCNSYPYLPPQCSFVPDPADTCCRKARCSPIAPTPSPTLIPNPLSTIKPNTTPNIVVNPGTGPGSGGVQTTPNVVNTPVGPTGIGGRTTPVVVNPVTYTPGGGSNTTPKPFNMCLYKGQLHPKGSSWKDGCDFTCYCVDPPSNSYRCQARCPTYSSVPSYCKLVPDTNDACCEKVQCTAPNGQVLTPQIPSGQPTLSPTLSPSLQHVIPVGTHQVFTGSGQPNSQTIPGMSGGRSGCIYRSTVYLQGQSWDDGCKYVCTCEDGSTGLYKCTSKCPTYPPLPSYCKFVNVPGQCCPSLTCNSPDFGKYNPTPQLNPTPAPAIKPTAQPHVIYVPGQTGPGTGGTSQVVPGTSATGFTGSRGSLCIYKNKLYNQGDKWNDGCDYSCECKDAQSGYYECKPRCPTYQNLPSQCFLERAVGECCPQPKCRNPDGTTTNPITSGSSYPVFGSYGGGFTGFRPNYVPGQGSMTNFTSISKVCIYKGVTYTQGQSWDDGCDYTCTCTDQNRGLYQCQERCKTYTNLPPVCKMYDIPGDCCKEVRCNGINPNTNPTVAPPISATTVKPHLDPNCYDKLDNCKAYGQQACGGTYEAWARENCNMYCKYCTPSVVMPTVCEDRINNCPAYGKSVCTGQYRPWAGDNCAKYCGLCTSTSNVTPAPSATTACVDKKTNCVDYGSSVCTGKFAPWARDNCVKFCNFCVPTGTAGGTIYNVLPPNGYMTLMKGVAGVPGNLYQIWNSPNTMNANVPQAMFLTSQYPGHFKPDLVSRWNQLCLDKVRVSIYNKGQEKAYVEFDARGADKNNWFDSSRIISSSYTDIKNAPKQIFSMLGDTTNGRQFLMSQQSNGRCDTYGWIMVATQNGCPFESSSGNKPAFLYAPGQTSTHFDQTQVGSGDVLAILGHQGNCQAATASTVTGFTDITRACVKDGKIYQQGQSWTDGCKYNCTCTDASRGFYQCFELCPAYSRLPQGCSLVKRPGQCCAVPDCGSHVYNPYSQNRNETGLCYYKGDVYYERETWDVGCEYKCTCLDASNGRYTCNAKCLSWPNLPSVCKLNPPGPGLCCKQPSCPNYVHLQYPPGFKIE